MVWVWGRLQGWDAIPWTNALKNNQNLSVPKVCCESKLLILVPDCHALSDLGAPNRALGRSWRVAQDPVRLGSCLQTLASRKWGALGSKSWQPSRLRYQILRPSCTESQGRQGRSRYHIPNHSQKGTVMMDTGQWQEEGFPMLVGKKVALLGKLKSPSGLL